MTGETKNLAFDADLLTRLSAIADKKGVPIEELATVALNDFVTAEEQGAIERGVLEHRWTTYLETGETISAEKMRRKLQDYAAEAGRRMEM